MSRRRAAEHLRVTDTLWLETGMTRRSPRVGHPSYPGRSMDLDELGRLWERHPAWRVLRAHDAPLILSFLGRRFIDDNRGAVPPRR